MLFNNAHFRNLLGDLLTKRASTVKLEKFFANQVKEKLKELNTSRRIDDSLGGIQERIKARLARLQSTPFDFLEDDKENRP